VLVDAAKGCGTTTPDLSRFKADFVAISFTSYLTTQQVWEHFLSGMDAAHLLRKNYFTGGTVAVSIAEMR
jgi:molybdenum cofactor sulfurtransferase